MDITVCFNNVMSFKPADRIPAIELATYWDKTIERWYKEGMPGDYKSDSQVHEYFGLDRMFRKRFRATNANCPKPEFHGAALIKNTEDYHNLKTCLFPKEQIDKAELENYAMLREKYQGVFWVQLDGFFWFPRVLFGIEAHMFAFYDNPELMKEMNADILEYNLWLIEEICKICVPNFIMISEDMSYNNGPMLSKKSFDEFIAPYYRRLIPHIKKHNIMPIVDSDGDVAELICWLEDVGVEGIAPLERMAGVDVAKIRQNHPSLRMIGAFDKTIMQKGCDAMRAEFERLLPVMKKGGFIPSVDHQTPPDVSLENYRCYVSLLKEYCQKAVL